MKRVITVDGQGAIEHCYHFDMKHHWIIDARRDPSLTSRICVSVCPDCERAWTNDREFGGWKEIEVPTVAEFVFGKFRDVKIIRPEADL